MWIFIGGNLINLPDRRPMQILMIILVPAVDCITLWMLVFSEGFQLPMDSERYLVVWHAKGILALTVARLMINVTDVINCLMRDQPYFHTIYDPAIIEAISVANAMSRRQTKKDVNEVKQCSICFETFKYWNK